VFYWGNVFFPRKTDKGIRFTIGEGTGRIGNGIVRYTAIGLQGALGRQGSLRGFLGVVGCIEGFDSSTIVANIDSIVEERKVVK